MKRARQFKLFPAMVLLVVIVILASLVSCATPTPTPTLTPTASPTAKPSPTVTPVKPIKLKFASDPPPTHWIHVNERLNWLGPEVERRSGGRLVIDFYSGGTLAKAEELYEAVVKGIADLSWATTGLEPGRFPLSDILALPFAFNTGAEGAALTIKMTPFLLREFPEVKVMSLLGYKGYALAFKKPVTKLEDLKGVRIRSGSAMMDRLIEALGGTPTFLTAAECYMALQTGLLGGIGAPWATVISYKWYEVARYGVDVATLGSTNVIPINKEKFNSLPPDLQKVLVDLGSEWPTHFGATQDRMDADAIKELTEKWGMQIYKLPPAELERWRNAALPVRDQWVRDLEAKGIPAKQAMDEFKKAMRELGITK